MRSLFAVLCVFAVLAAGCAGEDAGEGVTLTVWESYSNEERVVFMELVEEFKQKHRGLQVEVVSIPFDGMEPKILTSLATDTAPDIGRVDVAFLPKLAIRGALHQLDRFGVDDLRLEIRPVAMSSCIVDGKVYGVPDQVNGLCLF
jgi:ABC-type glycerol-3-phosphate transport system substrate-binding protein